MPVSIPEKREIPFEVKFNLFLNVRLIHVSIPEKREIPFEDTLKYSFFMFLTGTFQSLRKGKYPSKVRNSRKYNKEFQQVSIPEKREIPFEVMVLLLNLLF